jgi:hypothetical protein
MRMTVERALLVRMLRRMAEVFEAMDDAELECFFGGLQSRGRTSKVGGSRRAAATEPLTEKDLFQANDIVHRLQQARTRDEGTSILVDLNLTKRELVAIARARSVHITKEDNIRRIEEKLVEALIGSRLNSQAIRGESKPGD